MLQVGEPYYRVTYADVDLTIPGVEPMIYIGQNIFGDDPAGAEKYYFQDTVSYQMLGSAINPSSETHSEIEIEVYAMEEAALGSSIMSLDSVVTALQRALARQGHLNDDQ